MNQRNSTPKSILAWVGALWLGGATGVIVIALWCAVLFACVLASSCGVYLLWEFGRWLIG